MGDEPTDAIDYWIGDGSGGYCTGEEVEIIIVSGESSTFLAGAGWGFIVDGCGRFFIGEGSFMGESSSTTNSFNSSSSSTFSCSSSVSSGVEKPYVSFRAGV
jgi:hypothetical protein